MSEVTSSQEQSNLRSNGNEKSATYAVVKRISPEMEAIASIPVCKLIRPKIFPDERGFFCESYNAEEWRTKLGFTETFYQDNHSFSKYGVVRGLHAQKGMGKLVSVVSGVIFDVAVDIRPNSETFGKWHGVYLDGKSKNMFWIPDGFLHGFQCVSEEGAHVVYKCSASYDQTSEFGIDLFDAEIGIEWPILDRDTCIVSERDRMHPSFSSLKKQG